MAFRSVPRPSSPPGAKASTECPYRAQNHQHTHRNHPHPDCLILLLCWPPDASFCASGAHGPTAAPLRFSKNTPCDSAQRSLKQSLRIMDKTRACALVIPSTHSFFSRCTLHRNLRLQSMQNTLLPRVRPTQIAARTNAHQPLHTDKEQRHIRQPEPASTHPRIMPARLSNPAFPYRSRTIRP
jgi:hypothetical protein